jgi:hypothetical protein
VKGRKRRQTLTTDDEFLHLVNGWLLEPSGTFGPDHSDASKKQLAKHFWSELLEALWAQLSVENCAVEITAADERGLVDRPAWRIRVLTNAASRDNAKRSNTPLLNRKDFLHWVEDRIRTPPMPPSLTDKDLRRWRDVVKARREGLSWPEAYKAAKENDWRGVSAIRASYLKVQRMRRRPE